RFYEPGRMIALDEINGAFDDRTFMALGVTLDERHAGERRKFFIKADRPHRNIPSRRYSGLVKVTAWNAHLEVAGARRYCRVVNHHIPHAKFPDIVLKIGTRLRN